MNFKSAIITAATVFSALTMNVSAYTTTAVTETSAATTSTTVSETSVTTTHIPTAGSVIIDREKVNDNNYLNEILGYVGEDNAPHLNDNLKNNAMAINSTKIDYSEKSMYTITTRSGDVFYLIINSEDGSCLFLNSVDTADLTSLLNKGTTKNTMNENALADIEQMEQEQAETIPLNDIPKKENPTKKPVSGPSYFDSIIWIVGAALACVVVAVIVAVIKRRKNKNTGYEDMFTENVNENDEDTVSYSEE